MRGLKVILVLLGMVVMGTASWGLDNMTMFGQEKNPFEEDNFFTTKLTQEKLLGKKDEKRPTKEQKEDEEQKKKRDQVEAAKDIANNIKANISGTASAGTSVNGSVEGKVNYDGVTADDAPQVTQTPQSLNGETVDTLSSSSDYLSRAESAGLRTAETTPYSSESSSGWSRQPFEEPYESFAKPKNGAMADMRSPGLKLPQPEPNSNWVSKPTLHGDIYAPLSKGKLLGKSETIRKIDNYFKGSPLEGQNMGERMWNSAKQVSETTGVFVDPLSTLAKSSHEANRFSAVPAANNLGGNWVLGKNSQWTKSLPDYIRNGLDHSKNNRLTSRYTGDTATYQGFKSIDDYYNYQNYFLAKRFPSNVKAQTLPSGYAADSNWKASVTRHYNDILNGRIKASQNIPQLGASGRSKAGLTYSSTSSKGLGKMARKP